MLFNLALVAVVLAALWWLSRQLAAAPAGVVARGLKLAGLAALVAGGLFLVLTGRVAGLLAVVAGVMPWAMRLMRLHAFYQLLRRFGIQVKGGRANAGNTSEVVTRFLRMRLDHDSGRLEGEVLEGPYRGLALSALDLDQALELWRLVQVDPQSAQVLEAWLDRTLPDWRERAGADTGEAPSPPPGGGMTRDEAYEVLGLAPGAGPDDIREAHRRLMRLAHPDAGGSTWIAARLNQARDLLLGA